MVLSLSEQNVDFFNMTQKYQTMVFFGDSLYQTEEFKKAEVGMENICLLLVFIVTKHICEDYEGSF